MPPSPILHAIQQSVANHDAHRVCVATAGGGAVSGIAESRLYSEHQAHDES